jgi:hypothetical protein
LISRCSFNLCAFARAAALARASARFAARICAAVGPEGGA